MVGDQYAKELIEALIAGRNMFFAGTGTQPEGHPVSVNDCL